MRSSGAITHNPGIKEYQVRRLNRYNLQDIASLHSRVYNVPAPVAGFSKKYDTSYTGLEGVGYIAYDRDNLPIAYYGVIPCFIEYENKIILAAQSADTMTHPGHRYKGMFVELSTLTFALCRQLGIRLVFGFPNQQSYHGAVNKLGWQMTEAMSCFIIPVDCLPLEAICRKSRWTKKLYKMYRSFILQKYITGEQGLRNSAIANGLAGILRSADYLAYKQYHQSHVLQVGRAKLWVSGKDGFMLGDAEGLDHNNFLHVIDHIKRIARKLGVRQVQFHCSPGIALHALFASHFQPVPSYPVLFQDFGSEIAPGKIKFTFADIDIF